MWFKYLNSAVNDLAPILWSEPDEEWHSWAALRCKTTLGGALLDACGQLCPHFDLGDLILDIDPSPRPADAPAISEGSIWMDSKLTNSKFKMTLSTNAGACRRQTKA